MKTKAERFIDHVQAALIRSKRTVTFSPAVTAMWSLLRELEQASHAAIYIPETLSAEEAAELNRIRPELRVVHHASGFRRDQKRRGQPHSGDVIYALDFDVRRGIGPGGDE